MLKFTPPTQTTGAIPTGEPLQDASSETNLTPETPMNIPELVSLVREDFERSKSVKDEYLNDRLLNCVYAFRSEYTAKKLASIKEIGGSEVYIPLTNMKVRAGKAWLTDIFFAPKSKMFSLKPTPIPEPPPKIKQRMDAEIDREMQNLTEAASKLLVVSNGLFDASSLQEVMEKRRVAIKEEYLKKVKEEAGRKAEIQERKIYDQLVEGGFYEAISQVLLDIMLYPTGIIKGPVLRKKRRFITNSREVVDVVIPTFNRVSPFDAYPAPYASSFDDGYFIEVLHIPPKDLRSLIGVEGYYSDAIKEILGKYDSGGLKEWTSILYERTALESKSSIYDDTIDILEYWGSVEGKVLEEWDIAVEDRSEFYDICSWVVDNQIIKAMVNPEPLGTKPYNKASFVEIPDSFWGIAPPEILSDIQDAVNSLARASINNAVLSSGALIERNIDRLGNTGKKPIIPFQTFDVHESALNSAPAYRFYQLAQTADRLIMTMSFFQKMADEYSGIPAYAHGDVTVGGAGRTASGLSMLQNQASRGIKDVVKNIDDGIIKPLVEKQYYYNLYTEIADPSEIPDLTIEAKGSDNLAEKEVQSSRMLEYLQITSNPFDMQLMGSEGRKYLLEGVAKNSGLDAEKLFPLDEAQREAVMQMMQAVQGAPNKQVSQVAPNNTAGIPAMAQEMGQAVNQFSKENG